MKKKAKQICACLMACMIMASTVAVPKAEAFYDPASALAYAVMYSYMSSTGFTFMGKETAYGGMVDALHRGFSQFSRDFAVAREKTHEQFISEITNAVTVIDNGVIRLSSTVANLMADFHAWFIEAFNIPTGATMPIYTGNYISLVDGRVLPVYPNKDSCPEILPSWGYLMNDTYELTSGYKIVVDESGFRVCYPNGDLIDGVSDNNRSFGGFVLYLESSGALAYKWYRRDGTEWSSDGGVSLFPSRFVYDSSSVSLTVTLDDDEDAPVLEEQYSMVINTGLSFADEQGFIDSVLNADTIGDYAPTYEVTSTLPGVDDSVADTDGFLQRIMSAAEMLVSKVSVHTGVLQSISSAVDSLSDKIALAVSAMFAPDVELTTEITDTFSSKFGFMEDLHSLGADLLSLNAESEPPVVYIHLEDAEGNIDYGGTVKALDMSWYQRYKADGDRIIGGFLWLGFLWLLFKRVPDIINGAGMTESYSVDIDSGFRRRRGK